MRLRFGDVTFDGGRRALLAGSEPVHLSPKAYHLLELLLCRRPDAVSKAEIQESLWPGTFVSEANLPSLVNEVRHAIGDKGRSHGFIRTVHGFGYAFEGNVREVPDAAAPSSSRHVLVWGHQEIDLAEGANILGRERSAAIWIGHPSVSREHARIHVQDGVARIEDLGSKNGTYRGNERVEGSVALTDGDELRIGCVTLTYRAADPEAITETVG